VRASETAYGDLTVAAYRGTATSPVDVHAVAVDTTSTSRHIAPSVTPAQAGDWVVVFWADKSSANTGHTIPGTLTKRRTSAGSGTAHITATLADSGRPVPAGATGVFPATGAANASRAVMYTIALRPR
jgi:hypothetical protein